MKPPYIKGGQGRTSQEIRDSASALLWLIIILCIFILALVIAGHHATPGVDS